MKKSILLIMIGVSILNADFIKNGDIVEDSVSKLQWQDDAVGEDINWQGAIDRCKSLSLGGYNDWRVPNINELKSIVDRSKLNPAIVDAFEHTQSNDYWSSTTHKGYSSSAWFVYFYNGDVDGYRKDGSGYVRCVRGGQ